MALSVGIVLVLSLWSAFDVVTGQAPHSFDNFCEVPSTCQQVIQITFPCGFSTCVHYVVLNYECSKHEPCVRSSLSPWSTCTASCTPGGTRQRTFTCGIGGGLSCTQTETERCNVNTPCRVPDVDGNWGQWTTWIAGPCSASCCGGTRQRFRTRRCDNPPTSGNGAFCPGSPNDSDTQVCNEGQCPLVCNPGDQFFPDTCDRCVGRYYTCVNNQPVETFCTEPEVWSQSAMACVSLTLCNAIEPR